MADLSSVRDRMDVRGSDDEHVGTVHAVEGDRIKLSRSEPAAGGEHHFLHRDMIAAVEDGVVRLTRTAAQARDEWGVEAIGGVTDTDAALDEHGAEPGSPAVGP